MLRPVALRTTLPLATLRLTMAAGLRVVIGARGGVRALTLRAMLAAVGPTLLRMAFTPLISHHMTADTDTEQTDDSQTPETRFHDVPHCR